MVSGKKRKEAERSGKKRKEAERSGKKRKEAERSGKKRNQLRQAGPSWAGGTRASGTSLDGRGGSTEPTDPPQPTGLCARCSAVMTAHVRRN